MRYFGFFFCFFLFTGCSFWSQKSVDVAKLTQKNFLIYEVDITDRPYIGLGEVSATVDTFLPWCSVKKEVDEKLKEEAIKKDADALIFVRYKPLGASFSRLGGLEGKAQAVKFTRY